MTTENLTVSASNRDTYENESGTSNLTSRMFCNYTGRIGASAWQSNVPQGATINSATLQLYVDSTSNDDPKVDFYGVDADTIAAFDGTNSEVSSKAQTTATVNWTATGVGEGYESIDVTDIVQEIVNRAGWSAGNYLCIYAIAKSGSNMYLNTYDTDTSGPAKLDIDYTAAAGGAAKKRKLRIGTQQGVQLGF